MKEIRRGNPVKEKFQFQYYIFLLLDKIKRPGEVLHNEKTVDEYDLLYADIVDLENKVIYDVRGP